MNIAHLDGSLVRLMSLRYAAVIMDDIDGIAKRMADADKYFEEKNLINEWIAFKEVKLIELQDRYQNG